MLFRSDNANTITLKGYTAVDASIAWHYNKNTIFRLLGRNLTDRVYTTSSYGNQFILSEPRRFDLIAEMKF